MSSLNDIIDIIIYPFQKLIILLGSIEVFGVSLLSLLVAALIIMIIFNFFVGQHSMPAGGGFVGRHLRESNKSSSGNSSGKYGGSNN